MRNAHGKLQKVLTDKGSELSHAVRKGEGYEREARKLRHKLEEVRENKQSEKSAFKEQRIFEKKINSHIRLNIDDFKISIDNPKSNVIVSDGIYNEVENIVEKSTVEKIDMERSSENVYDLPIEVVEETHTNPLAEGNMNNSEKRNIHKLLDNDEDNNTQTQEVVKKENPAEDVNTATKELTNKEDAKDVESVENDKEGETGKPPNVINENNVNSVRTNKEKDIDEDSLENYAEVETKKPPELPPGNIEISDAIYASVDMEKKRNSKKENSSCTASQLLNMVETENITTNI